jgi:beta-phosphoglucomutase
VVGSHGRVSAEAVIFDLDGVIVSTDELHFAAWAEIADEVGIAFDRKDNERLRGVSRMESLDLLLGDRARAYDRTQKEALATRKNARYRELLGLLSPADMLPGVMDLLADLRTHGIRVAIGSSSRNAPVILKRIGLEAAFDAVADGNRIHRSKPDPEVFALAARDLGIEPGRCVVVEDALAGIDAALAAGMKAFAVGYAVRHAGAHGRSASLEGVRACDLMGL